MMRWWFLWILESRALGPVSQGLPWGARRPSRAAVKMQEYDCLISGGGPAGLAAGIELSSLGFRTVVVERRGSPEEFVKSKAFHYLIDKRGQRWTDRHGLTDALRARGVSNSNYTLTRIFPDRSKETVTPPLSSPEGIWIPRSDFLAVLAQKAREQPLLDVKCGSRVNSLDFSSSKGCRVCVVDETTGEETIFEDPRLLLGCDGLESATRKLSKFPEPVELRSPSAGLNYKILSVSSRFQVLGEEETVPNLAYTLPSALKKKSLTTRLGFLPVRPEATERTANVIRDKDHKIWTFKDEESMTKFFRDSFPQVPNATFPEAELARFAKATPGAFPKPQFAPIVAKNMNTHSSVFLLGDAAHAFPPDVGQGVNSALEDVLVLGDILKNARSGQDPLTFDRQVVAEYQAQRAPAAEAIARIVKYAFPYQYSQAPLRQKFFFAGFLMRLLLSKIIPFCSEPVALGVLKGQPYTQVWRRAQRTTLFYQLLSIFAATAIYLRFFMMKKPAFPFLT